MLAAVVPHPTAISKGVRILNLPAEPADPVILTRLRSCSIFKTIALLANTYLFWMDTYLIGVWQI
jgi:hypothetical protein